MKHLLLSVATILITNFAFGQLTLEHSFPSNQGVRVYNDGTTIYYFVSIYDSSEYRNTIHIYNSDYSLYRTITFPWDTSFDSGISFFGDYGISKFVFNTNNNFEFIVHTYSNITQQTKYFIIDEDGIIIKDLSNYYVGSDYIDIFHDYLNNVNKIRLTRKDSSIGGIAEIYLLPTTVLSTVDIQNENELSAFPIPANKILNVIKPKNGTNKIEVFDMSGKLMLNKIFENTENSISLDVEFLQKGIYIYKVGEFSAKFIKN